MAFLVSASWLAADGTLTGPAFPNLASEADVQAAVASAITRGRRERGANIRIMVMDDITARIVARVRPKGT